MADIRFYHLLTQSLEQALPAILSKALAGGRKIVVRFADEAQVDYFNDHFWTYNPDSFLPHGAAADKNKEQQPVYLTAIAENPNQADMLVLCNQHTVPENIADFTLCCDFLDGGDDDSVAAGRARWKAYKEAGHSVSYYQQTETGGWDQKA
ncbi:MAG: DNA polymerase III subunit chi [Micavibrio aeruginosavorus]|uniref:DNA polymerase III subunit chi n=1 Tax=Micavibrio aeruginosavorus TaxID=349221 RepID=A0A2W5Q1L5_9BACT|nr:MAG: DNA polymerase III subunit chi [Micavibrio aeruginosavorus]